MELSQIDARFPEFPEAVRQFLYSLLEEDPYCVPGHSDGCDYTLTVICAPVSIQKLVFLQASGAPNSSADALCFEEGSLVKEGSRYLLTGQAINYSRDTSTAFTLSFSDIRLDVAPYRANIGYFYENPWAFLNSLSSAILDRAGDSGCPPNSLEEALFPLAIEICALFYGTSHPCSGFPQLKTLIGRHGFTELLPMVTALEKAIPNREKARRISQKLVAKLNTLKYEPLWREIFQRFTDSQASYPSKEALICPPPFLQETRIRIQKLLEDLGFTGTYPDFVKRGSIPGIRLTESYGMTYWVGHEKNAVFYIHCSENVWEDMLDITFLCGTALLRPGESAGDIYTCAFNAKGRRIFHTVNYSCSYEPDPQESPDDLALKTGIAAKRAQLCKLTKQERKAAPQVNLLPLFLWIFLFGGGLFSIFMNLGMAILCAIVAWIFDGLSGIPGLLAALPWWQTILFAWLSFGGIMGLVTVLAAKE